MSDRSSEILTAEATAELTGQLDKKIQDSFPRIDKCPDVFNDFMARRVTHLSFPAFGVRPETRSDILVAALTHAVDADDAGFCSHGAKHKVFSEAVGHVSHAVEQFSATFGWKELPVRMIPDIPDGYVDPGVQKKRFIVESPVYQRRTARPDPMVIAQRWRREKRIVGKEMRRLALSGADGNAAAILAGVYYGLDEDAILREIGERNFQTEMLHRHYPKNILLHPKSKDDAILVKVLLDLLTVQTSAGRQPVFDFESYAAALLLLEKHHLIERNAVARFGLGMSETVEPVITRAVFKGLEEVAELYAPKDLVDPKRTKYIEDNFGGYATTNLITAYLIFP